MTLVRRDKLDGAVTMFGVVPTYKPKHLGARFFNRFKTLSEKIMAVFGGSEQRFRVGIVVRYSGAAVRGAYSQLIQFDPQRTGALWRAIVRLQYHSFSTATLRQHSVIE
jgi:hypothetical protein